MRHTLPILAVLLTAGCAGSSPSSPSTTPPTAVRWTLEGTITATTGDRINGASIAVLDGPDAGRSTLTDANGRFALADLQQGGFTVRASAGGYTAVAKGVTLTANTVMDLQLPRLPFPAFITEGSVRFNQLPVDGFEMFGIAVNSGTGCGAEVAGVTTLTTTQSPPAVLEFPWSLPTTRIIQPGERFEYRIGVMTDDQARRFPAGVAVTRFTFTAIPCP